jgi:glycerate 2-kinase
VDPREAALAIARAGIAAADPGRAVRTAIASGPATVRAGRRARRLRILAIGKAAAAMEEAARGVLAIPDLESLLVVPDGAPGGTGPARTLRGAHPVPNESSAEAGRAVLEWVRALPDGVPLLALVSGGGSSIVELPVAGVTIAELAATTECLLASGAPIQTLNLLRRHLSELKGGRLRIACGARKVDTLALSDVVGDAPQDIASGPTVPDPSSFEESVRAVDELGLRGKLPATVVHYLEEGAAGRRPETPKPGDPRFRGSEFRIVASNRASLRAACAEARRLGYRPLLLSSELRGESAEVAQAFAAILREVRRSGSPLRAPACLLAGGETTVSLPPNAPPGGRNQEFALSAARGLDGEPGVGVLAIGTDGVDGTTDAAGAWVDGSTAARARALGVSLATALSAHDSHAALDRLDALVRTGPTGTNVMDLYLGLVERTSARGTGGSSPPRAARSSRRRRS